jgi:hypothetical protein
MSTVVESSTQVKSFQLKDDFVVGASVTMPHFFL